jgi:hypothetical protein
MDQPIRKRLEDYLSGMDEASRRDFEAELARDQRTLDEVRIMRQHAELLRTLRAPEEVDPAPGFYARVMDRIESQRPVSVWDVFLQPVFARRVAYVSLALLLVFGFLTVSAEMEPEVVSASPEAILAERPVSPALGRDQERDREVVLVNLATYQY